MMSIRQRTVSLSRLRLTAVSLSYISECKGTTLYLFCQGKVEKYFCQLLTGPIINLLIESQLQYFVCCLSLFGSAKLGHFISLSKPYLKLF